MNNTVIQSLVRAIDIIKTFEEAEELGITEISSRTGLHKSTAYNIICTLERYKYLEKSESTGKYRLGIELFRMGTMVKSALRRVALPYLENLVVRFKETANLVIRDGDYVVYLEKIESPHSMRISTVQGGRLPINTTAVGKAILSGLPENEMLEIVNGLTFHKFTEHTICHKSGLLKAIAEAKTTGYAVDFEELEVGLTCIAAPIYNHTGKACAAISISGPTSRMGDEIRAHIAQALIEATGEISKALGCK